MLQPLFRGGCHACFCRPDGWIPSVRVLCQHGMSPWLPRRTARSAPPSFYPPSRKQPPAAAQKFVLVSHLMANCQHLQTQLLVTPTALMKRCRSHPVWVAWTDFGSVGVGRRAILGKSDKFSQDSSHPGVDPVRIRHQKPAVAWASGQTRPGPFHLRTAKNSGRPKRSGVVCLTSHAHHSAADRCDFSYAAMPPSASLQQQA